MLDLPAARDRAASLVELARKKGADAADAVYVGDRSQGVSVRLGQLEDVHRSEGEEIGFRVFIGKRNATVASSDLSKEAMQTLVERALAMAAEAPEDQYAGLAPEELLFRGVPADLDLDDGGDPDPAELRQRALAAEDAARAIEGVTNSGGAGASASASTLAIANSNGFAAATRATGYSNSVSVVAGTGSTMQRDYAWHSARHLADLEAAEEIGDRAARRAVSRLNPVSIKAGVMPVLFDPRVATTLLGHFVGAISGSAIARQTSFLLDALETQVFAEGITIHDDPFRKRGLRSRAFDGEGLPVRAMNLVDDGVLTSWLADSASARQLGIQPTGHAIRGVSGSPGAGPANLTIAAGQRSREDMIAGIKKGVLITELIGQGVNGVTGDYSRGAAGYLITDGEIGPAIAEITVASNLKQIFATLEPANDLRLRRGIDSPTLLVPEMTVASA
ncbi:TldD/PmbA family protein [Sphingomonas sp. NSE70-1]|uniref:TldD/PmbA family protein n=1 Tax=Sphingomonas caseinilyticus TaxID=2908205 RepID=A0ABT0RWG5_9SPHN|nr:TldD/PmbA family protein [Sphingomonas caseinilyticus]MCL6699296.1 TldD/PmbA family protein [Sphingomonas caseinilyticus]